MPEVVHHPEGTLPVFGGGAGKGSVYTPLPQDIEHGRLRAHAVQTILAEPMALYILWRDIELAPRWQEFVVAVTVIDERLSHWVMGDPADAEGKRVEFDSEIVEDVAGESLAWHSITGDVDEAGHVTFAPAPNGRGTIVTLQEYAKVPGGKLGNAAAALAKRTPRQIVIEDLRHFKQLAETGEIPTAARNPHGPRGLSGGIKAHLYGETNPTPPGTSNIG